MPAPYSALLRKLGWLERIFLIALAAAFAGSLQSPAGRLGTGCHVRAFVLGLVVAVRWLVVGMRRIIWRLRYRLVVAYLFIAVVPILLIVTLVGCGRLRPHRTGRHLPAHHRTRAHDR